MRLGNVAAPHTAMIGFQRDATVVQRTCGGRGSARKKVAAAAIARVRE
jgi:hypothetical protein